MELVKKILTVLGVVTFVLIVLFVVALSLAAGLFLSVFIGIFLAYKSCIVGIHEEVTNPIIAIMMYVVMGIIFLTPIALIIYGSLA